MVIDLGERELTCFTPKGVFNTSNIEFFIGTVQGKLIYFYKGWISDTKEIIHDKQDEGPIISLVHFDDLVAWATPKNIRVIYFAMK